MKITHSNRNVIQSNAKHGKQDPIIRFEENGVVAYCMIYSPDKPRKCGDKLWIETDADVELIGEKQ